MSTVCPKGHKLDTSLSIFVLRWWQCRPVAAPIASTHGPFNVFGRHLGRRNWDQQQ